MNCMNIYKIADIPGNDSKPVIIPADIEVLNAVVKKFRISITIQRISL